MCRLRFLLVSAFVLAGMRAISLAVIGSYFLLEVDAICDYFLIV